MAGLTPDAVIVDPDQRSVIVLEYTRPSDTAPGQLHEAADRKTRKYAVILRALRRYARAGWRTKLFPLPVGVRGTLSEDHWGPALEELGIPENKRKRLLQSIALASVRAVHLLHLCRHQLLRAPEHSTLRGRRREFAMARWGRHLPEIGAA